MTTFKAVVRQSGSSELSAVSLDAASTNQARCFIRESMPDSYIVSLKQNAWKLDVHFEFVTVSHTTHIAQHSKARKKRGCDALPVMYV